jgi:hypothetical protein
MVVAEGLDEADERNADLGVKLCSFKVVAPGRLRKREVSINPYVRMRVSGHERRLSVPVFVPGLEVGVRFTE